MSSVLYWRAGAMNSNMGENGGDDKPNDAPWLTGDEDE